MAKTPKTSKQPMQAHSDRLHQAHNSSKNPSPDSKPVKKPKKKESDG